MKIETAIIKRIKKYLKNGGIYETIDDILIEELAFNVALAKEAKIDIEERGIVVNISKDEKRQYFQPNFSVNTYNQALKSIMSLSTKLNIAPQERIKMGLISKKNETSDLDEFSS